MSNVPFKVKLYLNHTPESTELQKTIIMKVQVTLHLGLVATNVQNGTVTTEQSCEIVFPYSVGTLPREARVVIRTEDFDRALLLDQRVFDSNVSSCQA